MSAEVTRLHFSEGFASSNVKLFEVEEDVLKELLKDDGSVRIKGAPNDEAVLCTADKTFTLRSAESSNSFLLAPNAAAKAKPAPPLGRPAPPLATTPCAPPSSHLPHYWLVKRAPPVLARVTRRR